ncbi:PREDICTED: putative uncharacterized protein FLJ37770 [Cyphomyrmex costatus]|uniref:putative uncharacterized protein FLJ37770 n=1 Tax=Cyphomyrmex costatus TaxID=456900 RepID=UPI0008523B71|nr:PREDICTED: putative uncharacterized protein FLJ37770 [Cyphomyrmex costatus]
MLQKCYGDDTLSKTQVYQWYERFKSGREAVEDDARPGRPSTSKTDENVDEIRQLLIENRKLTIREIAETTNISFGSVQSILREDLGLSRVTARLVPKELNFVQKLHRAEISKEMVSMVDSDPTVIQRIITGDETWVYEYDTQTQHQSSEWRAKDEPRPKKRRRFQSKKKARQSTRNIT